MFEIALVVLGGFVVESFKMNNPAVAWQSTQVGAEAYYLRRKAERHSDACRLAGMDRQNLFAQNRSSPGGYRPPTAHQLETSHATLGWRAVDYRQPKKKACSAI